MAAQAANRVSNGDDRATTVQARRAPAPRFRAREHTMAPKPERPRGAAATLLSPTGQPPSADRRPRPGAMDPAGLEYDGGGYPDKLLASLAKGRKTLPFGFKVTDDGRLLKPGRMITGFPFRPSLGGGEDVGEWEPVSAQEKQMFVEDMVDAKATYVRGRQSPQEQQLRAEIGTDRGRLPKSLLEPVSATTKGEVVTFTNGGGATYTQTGSLATRNNNPLNMENGAYARQLGAIGGDRFAIFPNSDVGFEAAIANFDRIERKHRGAQNGTGQPDGSLAMLVYIWSPPKDHNDTEGMIQFIAQKTGLGRNVRYQDLSRADRLRFLHAYSLREGYRGPPPH